MSQQESSTTVPQCPPGKILRSGYIRKGYTRKDGVHVKETYVPPVCIDDPDGDKKSSMKKEQSGSGGDYSGHDGKKGHSGGKKQQKGEEQSRTGETKKTQKGREAQSGAGESRSRSKGSPQDIKMKPANIPDYDPKSAKAEERHAALDKAVESHGVPGLMMKLVAMAADESSTKTTDAHIQKDIDYLKKKYASGEGSSTSKSTGTRTRKSPSSASRSKTDA